MDYQNSPNPQQSTRNEAVRNTLRPAITVCLVLIMVLMFLLCIQVEPLDKGERDKFELLQKQYRELQNSRQHEQPNNL